MYDMAEDVCMPDLNNPEDRALIIDSVNQFIQQVSEIHGVCMCCGTEIIDVNDVSALPFLQTIHIFCNRCGEILATIRVFDRYDFDQITDAEMKKFKKVLNSKTFEKRLNKYIKENMGDG